MIFSTLTLNLWCILTISIAWPNPESFFANTVDWSLVISVHILKLNDETEILILILREIS